MEDYDVFVSTKIEILVIITIPYLQTTVQKKKVYENGKYFILAVRMIFIIGNRKCFNNVMCNDRSQTL